jgi:anti-sigma factor RsiW
VSGELDFGGGPPVSEDDIQAAIDGRLAPDRRPLVESWLSAHPEAAARVGACRRQREALRAVLAPRVELPIPSRLRIAHIAASRRAALRLRFWRAAAAILLFAAGAAGGWTGRGLLAPFGDAGAAGPGTELTRDAIAAHRTYVVEMRHPVEVDATQEAHLVQWLSKRLGHQLKVPDLTALGYRLIGGRLLPGTPGGPAAQMMYQEEDGHRLTLYLRADADDHGTAFRYADSGGVAAFYWVDGGFGYAVSAAVDRRTLLRVAETVYRECEGKDLPNGSR